MRTGLNAHLLTHADGYRRAGIHGYIEQLLAHLPAAAPDDSFTVFTKSGDPPVSPQITVRRSRLNTDKPLNRILWEQAVQPWQLGGLDLIHELAFVAPLILPCPAVVTIHDLSFMRYPERLPAARRLYLRLLTGLSCQRARRVIAVSQSTANDLVSLLDISPQKIDVVVHGVEARFRPQPREQVERFRRERSLPDRSVLFLGTIEPRKNLPMLLRAYAALPEADRRTVHLVLAGGQGWMADDVPRTIEQFGLGDSVHMPGYISDSDLVMWYNAADALVYPSVFEGWGLPVTEAMACGKPVIVSNVSSLPEAAGGAGLTLPPDDGQAWTAALATCINDADWRAEWGARSLGHAAQFTWSRTAQQTVACYRRALHKAP